MRIQRSPNRWSCLPTSFAMALDVSLEIVLHMIGHDGTEMWWPSLPEPFKRRAFHIQELINVCWSLGYSVTPHEALPYSQGSFAVEPREVPLNPHRLETILRGSIGVITGATLQDQAHAVAWNGEICYDPNGTICPISNYKVGCFWAIKSM